MLFRSVTFPFSSKTSYDILAFAVPVNTFSNSAVTLFSSSAEKILPVFALVTLVYIGSSFETERSISAISIVPSYVNLSVSYSRIGIPTPHEPMFPTVPLYSA